MWWTYALLSAVFAALTAILAKLGVKGVDSSNVATAVRTSVVLVLAWVVVAVQGNLAAVTALPRATAWLPRVVRLRDRRVVAVPLQGAPGGPGLAGQRGRQIQLFALTLILLAALVLGESLTPPHLDRRGVDPRPEPPSSSGRDPLRVTAKPET